jgi:hypothetical protein
VPKSLLPSLAVARTKLISPCFRRASKCRLLEDEHRFGFPNRVKLVLLWLPLLSDVCADLKVDVLGPLSFLVFCVSCVPSQALPQPTFRRLLVQMVIASPYQEPETTLVLFETLPKDLLPNTCCSIAFLRSRNTSGGFAKYSTYLQ